jgi:hypothetical protein
MTRAFCFAVNLVTATSGDAWQRRQPDGSRPRGE